MERPYDADIIVVGAGAIGASTAMHLAGEGLDVAVVEKEPGPALHQSGRNSGVIHAGYNPKPGTDKAEFCIAGNEELRRYCLDKGIPATIGGILVTALDQDEVATLEELERRGTANGTRMEMVDGADIQRFEPHATGVAALFAMDGGSFNSRAYVHSLESEASGQGAAFLYDRHVDSIEEDADSIELVTDKEILRARVVVNAAGLYADKVAGDLASDLRVIPFRGYYAELKPSKADLVRSHLYRAPDLNFPFLGVHLSHRTDGRTIVGPGAMLAFGREAYSFGSFEGGGLAGTLSFPGFWKMIAKPEFRDLIRREVTKSFSLKAIWKEAQAILPHLEESDLVRSFAGNRAQLVDRNGNLVDDIIVRETDRAVHVLNAVSPGLTCSLPFGRDLAQRAASKL